MRHVQSGILAPVPKLARYLTFSVQNDTERDRVLEALEGAVIGEDTVVGLGHSLVSGMERKIEALRVFPSHVGEGIEVPSTPSDLWFWLRGDDRGELVHRTRQFSRLLSSAFTLETVIDAFQYGPSLDLTGYEDGTENPKGEDAERVAIVRESGEGLNGSSFVAVQQWVHDLDHFESLTPQDQDNTIGRRKSDNEEFEDAPDSAHVKRTAQESFEPEAFILRRSMPWADATRAGLVFVSFGQSFDAFEALLNRMVGAEDGIPDALFTFTRPMTGSYFWCPPVSGGHLDLSAIRVKVMMLPH